MRAARSGPGGHRSSGSLACLTCVLRASCWPRCGLRVAKRSSRLACSSTRSTDMSVLTRSLLWPHLGFAGMALARASPVFSVGIIVMVLAFPLVLLN